MDGVRQVRTDQRRWMQALAIISVTVLFLLLNLHWLERYRHGGVLDIDEAGYLGYSTAYAKAWVGGGLKAWLNAVNAPGAHAPLLPALTSFLLAASGFSLDVGMLTNTLVACALIHVVHALCRMLGGGALLSFAAAVFLATLPAVVDYSRNYQFAMLAALAYAGTMLAIIKSDGFAKRAWSVWAGVFLACLILSRTMTVAFLPCFGLAALFAIWSSGGLRDKAVWRNVGWAALAFFLVALTWYARHYKSVFEYLFSFGYGANAAEYGKNVEEGYLHFFLARVRALMNLYLRPYHFFVLLPLFCLTAVVSLMAVLRAPTRQTWGGMATGVVLVVSSFLVLSSSKNQGSAFELPLICTAVAIAFAGVDRLLQRNGPVLAVTALSMIASVPFFYSQLSVDACAHLPSKVLLPYFGQQRPFDCRGTIHQYVAGDGELASAPDQTDSVPLTQAESLAWRQLSGDVAAYLGSIWPSKSIVMFGTRNYLFNVNTVNLEMLATTGEAFPAVQIEPTLLHDNEAEYRGWIQEGVQRGACVVLTASTGHGEFRPKPVVAFLVNELGAAGFLEDRQFAMPGGGSMLSIWRRDTEACRGPSAASVN